MSVTFCLGNVGVKRRSFLQPEPGAVCADNDDILLHFRLNGRLYCALGYIPFADFTVRDYVAYARSLKARRPLGDDEIRFILRSAGFRKPLYCRVGSLTRVEYRHLCLAAKLEIDTKTIRLNFDGLPYSARHRRQLLRLLRALDTRYDVRVAVTDTRFIPAFAETVRCGEDGTARVSGRVQLSRPARKGALLRRFRDKNIPLCGEQVQKILLITAN